MTDARTVRELIDEGRRFDADHAVHIIVESCKAFSRVDPRGVMSPARILISEDGTVSLNSELTAGAVVATFGYVAPENVPTKEEVRAEARRNRYRLLVGQTSVAASRFMAFSNVVDRPLAAVYAFGCILWELLAQRPLFRGSTLYQTMQDAGAAIVPPLPDVPSELAAVIRKALSKDIVERYRNPAEFADALSRFLLS